jgi:hypothetical protein
MRQTAPIFNATEQQNVSVRQSHRTSIEGAIDRVWPIFSAENRIAGMASEQGFLRVFF